MAGRYTSENLSLCSTDDKIPEQIEVWFFSDYTFSDRLSLFALDSAKPIDIFPLPQKVHIQSQILLSPLQVNNHTLHAEI